MLYKISLPIAMLLGIFIAYNCDNHASSTENKLFVIVYKDKEHGVICYGRTYSNSVLSCVYVGDKI